MQYPLYNWPFSDHVFLGVVVRTNLSFAPSPVGSWISQSRALNTSIEPKSSAPIQHAIGEEYSVFLFPSLWYRFFPRTSSMSVLPHCLHPWCSNYSVTSSNTRTWAFSSSYGSCFLRFAPSQKPTCTVHPTSLAAMLLSWKHSFASMIRPRFSRLECSDDSCVAGLRCRCGVGLRFMTWPTDFWRCELSSHLRVQLCAL